MIKAIYLSPSTQEANIGVLHYGTEERRMNEIADVVQKILRAHGVLVYRNTPSMTHITSKDASNILHRAGKISAHVAVHSDAGGGHGTSAYTSGSPEGYRLTKAIYDQVSTITPASDRGVRVTTTFTEVIKTTAPACLVEVAYHDLESDAIFILDNIHELGVAISKGVLNYFNVPFIQEVATGNAIYKVQAGSFRTKKYAMALLEKIKEIAPEAFIVTERP